MCAGSRDLFSCVPRACMVSGQVNTIGFVSLPHGSAARLTARCDMRSWAIQRGGTVRSTSQTSRSPNWTFSWPEGGGVAAVNSIFGEGVNPRLRKIRDGLEAIDVPSDVVLKHGYRRIVYGIPLASNFRDVLMGMSDEPDYILPQDDPELGGARIADYWAERWLMRRIESDSVLADVSRHVLARPVPQRSSGDAAGSGREIPFSSRRLRGKRAVSTRTRAVHVVSSGCVRERYV